MTKSSQWISTENPIGLTGKMYAQYQTLRYSKLLK